jgi:hypothetical protein
MMKHVVVRGELRGSDIRPPALLEKFRTISIEESRRLFGDRSALVDVGCPACGQDRSTEAFERNGFVYRECATCGTLFVSPRPTAAALDQYYTSSRAARFRAEYFDRLTGAARVDLILEARARWIRRLWEETGPEGSYGYIDIGTAYPGLLEQLGAMDVFCFVGSRAPPTGVELRSVVNDAEPPESVGALGFFEQLEHQFDPVESLQGALEMLDPGGLFFATTRSSSGFDVKVLNGSAEYIFVPEHLNLISVEGAAILLERLGLDAFELSTPGQLDVDLVQSALNDETPLPDFFRYMFRHRGKETLNEFQQFLQKNRLSSHLRIAAIKKG